MQQRRLASVFQQGVLVSCQGLSQWLQVEKHTLSFSESFAWKMWLCLTSGPSYPFVNAGSTQAAKEPVDHLDGTQNQLQTACGQQSTEQPSVELHNVLRLCALSPPCVVSQVTRVTVRQRGLWVFRSFKNVYGAICKLLPCVSPVLKGRWPDQNNFAEGAILQTEHRYNETVQGTSHTHCSKRNW